MASSIRPNISFIPKKPLAKGGAGGYRRPVSLFLTISIMAAVISISAYLGLYFYERSVAASIADKKVKLEAIDKQLNTEVMTEAQSVKRHIDTGATLLDRHVAGSPIFALLEENTLTSAVISKFMYETDEEGARGMAISVETNGFSQAASFYDEFKNIDEFKSVSMSNVDLTEEGNVTFDIHAVFDKNTLSYVNDIKNRIYESGGLSGIGTESEEDVLFLQDNELTD